MYAARLQPSIAELHLNSEQKAVLQATASDSQSSEFDAAHQLDY